MATKKTAPQRLPLTTDNPILMEAFRTLESDSLRLWVIYVEDGKPDKTIDYPPSAVNEALYVVGEFLAKGPGFTVAMGVRAHFHSR